MKRSVIITLFTLISYTCFAQNDIEYEVEEDEFISLNFKEKNSNWFKGYSLNFNGLTEALYFHEINELPDGYFSIFNPLIMFKNGRVGIGSSNPAAKLHVNSQFDNANIIISGKEGNNSLEFRNGIDYKGAFGWDTENDRLFVYQEGNGLFVKDGKVGVSGINPQANHALSVNGTASKTTAGSWAGHSDMRLKTDIKSISSQEVLQKILQMRGVSYKWDDDQTGINRPQGSQIGFVAQELEELWPEKITKDEQGFLMATYGDFDPMFVEAFKAQQEMIQELHGQVKALKEQIKYLINIHRKNPGN